MRADLGLSKTLDVESNFCSEGCGASFTITLTNNGPSTATNIEVQDTITDGWGCVESTELTSDGAYDDVTGVWTVTLLASGSTATLHLDCFGSSVGMDGEITNTVTITGVDQTDPNPANNQDSVTVGFPV